MWGRFPFPWRMPGPDQAGIFGRFPQPGPMMGPGGGGMWQRFPQPGPMMGPGGGGGPWSRFPLPGPGPMMGPDGGGMPQRFPWMMGPRPQGDFRFPNPDQMGPEGMDDPSSEGRLLGSPKASCSRDLRSCSPASSDGSGASFPRKRDTSKDFQEPDSSTSFEGKKHKKDYVEEAEEEEADYFVGPYCEVCELHLRSEHMLWSHMSGKKHLKALKALDSGRPLPKKIQVRKEKPSSSSKDKEEYSSFERAFASLTADEPVIGLGFVVEMFDQNEDLFTCELCDSKCNQNNMVLHIIGLKHRMTYLKKCDPERYSRLKKQQKRSKLTEDTRQLCKEVESEAGRGRARYRGPMQPVMERDYGQFQKRELKPEERRMAMEDLRRILMQDFMSRNIDPDTAQEMLNERMELMNEYERRGVPFDLAKERVIEEEDRWSLLLEFERQTLSFDEAEERISYRMDLLKAYIVNDCPKEEARKKVLDDEVIRDFRKEFQRLGMHREQAQKQVEKRLWMLERLHYKGFSQEAASQKVMKIERELGRLLQQAKEDGEKHKKVSEMFSWMKAGEDLEKFIEKTFYELELSSAQREKHIKLALDSLDRYRKDNVDVDKAKKKVLVEDLPIPEDKADEEPVDEPNVPCPPEKSARSCATPSASSSTVGTKDDIAQRVKMFMTKLYALLQIDKQNPGTVDREKQLAMFDQLSQLEMQSLLSDMNKSSLNAYEAKNRFVDLFQQHENLRKSLFPFTRTESSSQERLNVAFKMFVQHYSLSKDDHLAHTTNRPSSKDKSDSLKHRRARSRSVDRCGHSSRRRRSRSRRHSSNDRSSPDNSPERSRVRSRSVDRRGHSSRRRKSRSRRPSSNDRSSQDNSPKRSRARSRSVDRRGRSPRMRRSRSRSAHRQSRKGKTHSKRKDHRRSPSPEHKQRYRLKGGYQSSSPEYE